MITAVSTLVIGNLFALRQDNIKRFLAFSSIAQVGFILVGITANDASGTASVTYFILVYLFSNLAAFGVASVIADSTGRENISDYRGLYASHPMLCWVMALALFSLAGIPPTAGFFGKVFLLGAGASRGQLWLIVIAALNMVISLYYYLRVVRAMFMEKQLSPIGTITQELPVRFALLLCVAGILLTGLLSWIYEYIRLLI
jgi:NADH-quinone oxidoreductase subunit N